MAEEDLIFGKNRHLFGGIEPNNMKTFTVTRNIVKQQVEITAQLPGDTMVDDQLLCTIGGAVIRRKTTDYPVDEFDGDFVAEITTSGTKTITDAEADVNTIYYYSAFPYSTQGVYNRGHKNRAMYNFPAGEYYFGFDLKLSNNNPSTRVTYPSDVMNVSYTPAKINRSSGVVTFDYGSWPSTPGDKFMPRPCVVNIDSTQASKPTSVSAYVNPNDYSKSVDGSDISSYGTDQEYIKYMMEWPKIYTHREVVDGVYKFRCSDAPLGDDWDCLCNYDANGAQIDHFYTAIYKGYHGRKGAKPTPSSPLSKSADEWITYIENAKGQGWKPFLLVDLLLIQDLMIMMAKTTDLSTAYGCWQSFSSEEYNGVYDKNGMFYANSSATEVKVFGMEHFWSNYGSTYLVGLRIRNGDVKMKLAGDYTVNDDYTTVGSISADMTNQYISSTANGTYGRIPIGGEGSSTTYECNDISYKYNIAIYSAIFGSGLRPGPFAIKLNFSPTDIRDEGYIRFSYKPLEGNHNVT